MSKVVTSLSPRPMFKAVEADETEPLDTDAEEAAGAYARLATDQQSGLPARYRRGDVRGEPITVRLQPDLLKRLDDYAKGMTRPEAIRRILAAALR